MLVPVSPHPGPTDASTLVSAPARAIVAEPVDLQALADLAVGSLGSSSSRRNYRRELRQFLGSGLRLSREGVQTYLQRLRQAGKGTVTRNVALAAIRLLAREAWIRGLLADTDIGALERIRTEKVRGERLGHWLSVAQVRELIAAARDQQHETRNVALLAVLVGCGLRREEVSGLTWDQWQQRDGRWIWCDLRGKGGRMRSVPCPDWAAEFVNEWKEANCDANSSKGAI